MQNIINIAFESDPRFGVVKLMVVFALLLGYLFTGCNNAIVEEVDRAADYDYRPGYPELRVVGAGMVDVETDSAFIEISAEVVYASLVFKKTLNRFNSLKQLNYLYISIVSFRDCINIIKLPTRI